MSITDIFIIISASLIGILYLLKLRSYDIYEKEPFYKLLLMMILGGLVSVFVSLVIYVFIPVEHNLFDAIFKIGIIEESSKLFALVILYLIIKKDFNEIVDGIMYISAIALGFAVIENISYCFNSEEPFLLLFNRSIFAVMGHISFSGYMGIAFYIHKKVHKNYIGILVSLAISALAHGFYDGVIFHYELSSFFQFVFLGLVILQFWLLRTALGFSKRRVKLNEALFNTANTTLFLHCCHCDKNIQSKELNFRKIKAGQCEHCGYYVFNEESIYQLLKYFCPIKNHKRFIKNLPTHNKILTLDENNSIRFNMHTKHLSADINALSAFLDYCNTSDKERIFKIPVIGFIFKYLGLRYMK